MPQRKSAEETLTRLRGLVVAARSMPMSASCVINRSEVLAAIDDVIANLPDEVAEAQHVIDTAQSKIADAEAEAARVVSEAHGNVAEMAAGSEVVRVANEQAATVIANAEAEAEALRKETDIFIDARMASFESVLHKTSSQVKTARIRLSERSSLDKPKQASTPTPAA